MLLRQSCVCTQGRLRCLGSPSRLKARYGGALALEVQAGASAAAQAALAAWAAAELSAELQVLMPLRFEKPNMSQYTCYCRYLPCLQGRMLPSLTIDGR